MLTIRNFGKWTAFAATTALVAQLLQVAPASAASDAGTAPTLTATKSSIAWNGSTEVTTKSTGLNGALFVDGKFCADLGGADAKGAAGEAWNLGWGANSSAFGCTKNTAAHIAQLKLYSGSAATAASEFVAASKNIALLPAVAPAVKEISIATSAKFGSSVLEATVVGAVGTTGVVQWRRDGKIIHGISGQQYVVGASDYGHKISALVRVHTDGLVDAVKISDSITPVAPSTDSTLSKLTVNGIDASAPNSVITVPAGTTKVDVKYTKSNAAAQVWVLGADNLHDGDNVLRVVVVAQDGSSQTYTSRVVVASASNTGLSKFTVKVGGISLDALTLGASRVIYIPLGTKSVETSITTSDPDAIATVVGDSGLVDGANQLVVRVIAANGITSQEYRVTLIASAEPTGIKKTALGDPLPSSDTSLSTFTVDGFVVSDGYVVTATNGTTSVDVSAIPTDALATVSVVGDTGLTSGLNVLTVTVIAEDGTQQVYTITVNVLLSNDTSLFEFPSTEPTSPRMARLLRSPLAPLRWTYLQPPTMSPQSYRSMATLG